MICHQERLVNGSIIISSVKTKSGKHRLMRFQPGEGPKTPVGAAAIFIAGLAVVRESARVAYDPLRSMRSSQRFTVFFPATPQIVYTTLDVSRTLRANDAPPSSQQLQMLEDMIDDSRRRPGRA